MLVFWPSQPNSFLTHSSVSSSLSTKWIRKEKKLQADNKHFVKAQCNTSTTCENHDVFMYKNSKNYQISNRDIHTPWKIIYIITFIMSCYISDTWTIMVQYYSIKCYISLQLLFFFIFSSFFLLFIMDAFNHRGTYKQ